MEQFKIKHFLETHGANTFPQFESLSREQCGRVRRGIEECLGLEPNNDGLTIMSQLAKRQTLHTNHNAEDDHFDLRDFFCEIGITPCDEVFVNWSHFNDIDRIQLSDLSSYFHDIWYPSSDDVDLFDASFSWVVSIRHDGVVSYYRSE